MENISRIYFRASESNKIHSILMSDIQQSTYLKNIFEDKRLEHSRETNPIVFKEIKHEADQKFFINTPELLDIIAEYLEVWEGKYNESFYIHQDVVQVKNPKQILKECDLKIINKYISLQKNKMDKQEKQKYLSDKLYQKYFTIKCLSPLLCNVDGYFGIDSFANKIYAYIASVFQNCSSFEIETAGKDPYFQEMQKNIIPNESQIISKISNIELSESGSDQDEELVEESD